MGMISRGTDSAVYMGLEALTKEIAYAGGDVTVVTSGSYDISDDTGVCIKTNIDVDTGVGKVPRVTSISPTNGFDVSEEKYMDGTELGTRIRNRKTASIQFTTYKSSEIWAALYNSGRFGIDVDAFQDSTDEYDDDFGYRVVFYDGNTYSVYRNCILDDMKESLDRNGATTVTITFVCNDWDLNVAAGSITG